MDVYYNHAFALHVTAFLSEQNEILVLESATSRDLPVCLLRGTIFRPKSEFRQPIISFISALFKDDVRSSEYVA
jgi:hypothetical protein